MTDSIPSRLLAISDIHGHAQGLLLLLEQAHYRAGTDRLIMLGDYVNKEADSWSALLTIKSLTEQGAIALPGNTDLAVSRIPAFSACCPLLAGWLDKLPLYHTEEEEGFLFVHAGVRPGVPLAIQTRQDLTEIRESFWREDTGLSYTIVFGHTPTFNLGAAPGQLWFGERRIGIDTGAKHGLRLTLLDLTHHVCFSCSTSPECMYQDIRINTFH